MTQNQINYAKLQEEKRHNQVTEGYTGIELQETKRHNVSGESINWYSAQEQARHNASTEGLNWYIGQSQKGMYDAQASNQRSLAAYNSGMLALNTKRYELDERKFSQQVWKEIKDVERDMRNLDISEMNAETARQSMLNAAEDMLWRYNLSVDQYVRSGYYRDMAGALKDLTQAGVNTNKIIDDLLKSIGDFIISQSVAGYLPAH